MAFAKTSAPRQRDTRAFLIFFGCLVLILGLLFARSFQPGYAHFSNDGPLGVQKSACNAVTDSINGQWNDLYWVGFYGGSAPINLNSALSFLLGPVGFAKFLAPISMLLAAICAWAFFRQIKLNLAQSVVAGLAVALNSNFFSNVCWGLGSRALTLGMVFLALAAVTNIKRWRHWLFLPLAGIAVGIGIMDGADNGIIFSVYVGAYACYVTLLEEGGGAGNVFKGVLKVGIVAIAAGVMAAQLFVSVFTTQVAGVDDKQPPEDKWNFATQWSLPKEEIIRVLIPGVFGYRVDRGDGGQYWGGVGRQPGYEQHHQGFPRHSGSGEYAGVIVILVALWAVTLSLVGGSKTYSLRERKLIWFWGIVAFLSVLLAFGRHAPFYRLIFSLPYGHIFRNPIKFMHPFHLAIMILFGYGLMGLSRRYLEDLSVKPLFVTDQLKSWWKKAAAFEKKWTYGLLAFVGVSVLGMLVYSGSERSIVRHIASPDFDARFAQAPPAALENYAKTIANFSLHEVMLYVLFLALSAGLLLLIMGGVFAGRRAKWAFILLGLLLVADLARANLPWISFYNYEQQYASNPVLDIIKDKPWEHRVTIAANAEPYGSWLQHQFAYYNIQSLDQPQEPRIPAEKVAYKQAVGKNMTRLWELTNTRYILGAVNFLDQLNGMDGQRGRMRINTAFNLVPGATSETVVQTNVSGPLALLEFTGALPRAKLFARWQVLPTNEAVLEQLAKPEFDPAQIVLTTNSIPPSSASNNAESGAIEIVSYAPKRLQLRSEAPATTVMLLNDKFDPGWKATVDGKPQDVLRCNYFMQGLLLPPGRHEIEMRFQPSTRPLYVSLTSLIVGLVIAGLLIFTRGRTSEQDLSRKDEKKQFPKVESKSA